MKGKFIHPWVLMAVAYCFLHASIGHAQCNPTAAQNALQLASSDRNYQAIKLVEGCFPVPAPSVTVPVIQCNANHCGESNSLSWHTETRQQPRVNSTTGLQYSTNYQVRVGTTAVNAVNVNFTFQRNNTAGTWTLFLRGDPAGGDPGGWGQVGPGQATISVSVGKSTIVQYGTVGMSGFTELQIIRPPIIGVGAFEVPVLPLTIVYAPPQDGNSKNTNSYALSTTAATTITTSFSYDSGTMQPVDATFMNPPEASVLSTYKTAADVAKTVAGGDVFTSVSAAIPVIQSAIGSVSVTSTAGTSVQQSNTLTVADTTVDKETTGTSGGPGLDDRFVYLKNVKLMWIFKDGRVQLSMLGYLRGSSTGQFLLANKDNPGPIDCVLDLDGVTRHCIYANAARLLLSLDPFTAPLVNVPYLANQPIPITVAALSPPRFDPNSCTLFDLTGSDGVFQPGFTHSVTQQDQTANMTYSQTVVDAKAGWLGFAAAYIPSYVVPTTQTTTTKMTNTVSTASAIGTSIAASAQFNMQGNPFAVLQCYDSLFGTFAFVPMSVGTQATFAGQSLPSAGTLAAAKMLAGARRKVLLEIGGRKYVTLTDPQGRYAFHVPVGTGVGTLTIDNVTQPVNVGMPQSLNRPVVTPTVPR
jgi:hypothetical protein